MKLHELKIREEYFEEVLKGNKTFELRKNDRDYQVGDLIHFIEVYDEPKSVYYSPATMHETLIRQEVVREFKENPNNLYKITYILKDVPEYGLDKDYCILGIKKVED